MRTTSLLLFLSLAIPVHAQTTEDIKLTASDAQAGDELGWEVSVSGNRVLVGARLDGDNGVFSGSAYVYDATTGAELHKLKPSDGATGDHFGFSTDLDGNLAVIGAPDDADNGLFSGSAYLFDVSTGTELMKLTASDAAANSFFGWSVGIDGNHVVVGAMRDAETAVDAGAVYVFDTSGNELHKLLASDGAFEDNFGWSVAISGNRIVVGAHLNDANGLEDSGSAYLFDASSGNELHKLTPAIPDDFNAFGYEVDISGTNVIVGSLKGTSIPGTLGEAYLFDATNGNHTHTLIGPETYGLEVAIDGNRCVVGSPTFGAAFFAGTAFVHDVQTGALLDTYVASDTAAFDFFGSHVAIDGPTIAIGAHLDDDPAGDQGSVYLYGSPGGGGGPVAYCTAKTSSAGCVASISTSNPSAHPVSGANDYSITATQVHEQKPGLLFASSSGAAALPFGGGILCVQPPLKRGPILFSGGSNPNGCGGSFAQPVNDGVGFPNGFDAGPGNSIWGQFWLRDPGNGAGLLGTALSNGIRLDFQ